ncbi:MAG: hypothetical protein DRR19_03905 [Candidatus Parabeggiatoa sp. nov. 1]|nr:MAG: hypothetical protein DRR19_03905 [Gammaproteobacteria bacterium]
MATVLKYATVRMWNVQSNLLLQTLSGHQERLVHAAFSPDGLKVVTTSYGTAHLWNAQSKQSDRISCRHRGRGYDQKQLSHTAFSPNGQTVVTAYWDGVICLLDAQSGKLLQLERHQGPVEHIAFSPDGKTMVTVYQDGIARMWNVQSGQFLHKLEGHQGSVKHATFSHDGKQPLDKKIIGS